MNLAHKPTKIAITGASGTGKSTFQFRYLVNSGHKHLFVYDHEDEFAFRFAQETGSKIEEVSCNSFDDLKRVMSNDQEEKIVIFSPFQEFEDLHEGFDFFCEWVFEACGELQGTKLFACDELQKVTDVYKLEPTFTTLIEMGRRREIDTCFVAQQCNLMHNRLKNQLTHAITFRSVDVNAKKFIEASLGSSIADQLSDLDDGHFHYFNVRTGENYFDSIKLG